MRNPAPLAPPAPAEEILVTANRQGVLFHRGPYGLHLTANNSEPSPAPYEGQRAAAQEIRRLGRQCQWILDRLRRGPAPARDLAARCLKYTGRVSELRAAGYRITCFHQDDSTGETWYRLEVSEPDEKSESQNAENRNVGRRDRGEA